MTMEQKPANAKTEMGDWSWDILSQAEWGSRMWKLKMIYVLFKLDFDLNWGFKQMAESCWWSPVIQATGLRQTPCASCSVPSWFGTQARPQHRPGTKHRGQHGAQAACGNLLHRLHMLASVHGPNPDCKSALWPPSAHPHQPSDPANQPSDPHKAKWDWQPWFNILKHKNRFNDEIMVIYIETSYKIISTWIVK